MQKCFVADPIKHNKVKNRGELPQYYISDCHEPIIDKETFDKVQEILKQRAEAVPTYPFTKKIVCGTCGRAFTRKKGKIKGKTYIHWICRGKKEIGTTCSSVNFSEEELEKISAQMMEMQDFDSEAFENTVSMITVEKNGNLRFQFTDGSMKVWENLHLHPQRHEVTVTDCFQGKIVCAHCGNTYHRVVSGDRWVYWYCMGKKKKGVDCHSINYADFQLRRISASILRLWSFKESEFEKNIEKIVVLEDGSLEYHFYEGRTEMWQRM